MVSTEPPTESVSFRTAAVRSPGLLIIRAHASLEYVKKIAYFAMGSSIDCAGLSRVDRIEPQLSRLASALRRSSFHLEAALRPQSGTPESHAVSQMGRERHSGLAGTRCPGPTPA